MGKRPGSGQDRLGFAGEPPRGSLKRRRFRLNPGALLYSCATVEVAFPQTRLCKTPLYKARHLFCRRKAGGKQLNSRLPRHSAIVMNADEVS